MSSINDRIQSLLVALDEFEERKKRLSLLEQEVIDAFFVDWNALPVYLQKRIFAMLEQRRLSAVRFLPPCDNSEVP
jgi:hypothetical protein